MTGCVVINLLHLNSFYNQNEYSMPSSS